MDMSLRLSSRALRDVAPVHHNAPGRRLNQAVKQPYQGGLARTGKPHDDKGFSGFDTKMRIQHGNGLPRTFQHLLLGQPLCSEGERLFGVTAEHLEDVFNLYCFGHWAASLLF